MSQESVPRRHFLRQVLAVVPAAPVAFGAALTQDAVAGPSHGRPYGPSFFTPDEWRFVSAAVQRLIPADDLGPGALEAGVAEFIDRQMDTPYGHGKLWYMQGPFHTDQVPELGYQLSLVPRDLYRHGIAECDKWCMTHHGGRTFAQLEPQVQDAVLGGMEKGEVVFELLPAKTFFGYLLSNTKEGFLSDPMHGGNRGMVGWKMVGFPGARADFADWAVQPGVKYPYGPVSIDGRRA